MVKFHNKSCSIQFTFLVFSWVCLLVLDSYVNNFVKAQTFAPTYGKFLKASNRIDVGVYYFCYFAFESNRIESNRIESNRIESNRIKSNQIKPNQTKSNQI